MPVVGQPDMGLVPTFFWNMSRFLSTHAKKTLNAGTKREVSHCWFKGPPYHSPLIPGTSSSVAINLPMLTKRPLPDEIQIPRPLPDPEFVQAIDEVDPGNRAKR
jgi:hypothetical protein